MRVSGCFGGDRRRRSGIRPVRGRLDPVVEQAAAGDAHSERQHEAVDVGDGLMREEGEEDRVDQQQGWTRQVSRLRYGIALATAGPIQFGLVDAHTALIRRWRGRGILRVSAAP